MVQEARIPSDRDIRIRGDSRGIEHRHGRPIAERTVDRNRRGWPGRWDEEDRGNRNTDEDSGCDREISDAPRRIRKTETEAAHGGPPQPGPDGNAVDPSRSGDQAVDAALRRHQSVDASRGSRKTVHAAHTVHEAVGPPDSVHEPVDAAFPVDDPVDPAGAAGSLFRPDPAYESAAPAYPSREESERAGDRSRRRGSVGSDKRSALPAVTCGFDDHSGWRGDLSDPGERRCEGARRGAYQGDGPLPFDCLRLKGEPRCLAVLHVWRQGRGGIEGGD